MFKTLSKITFIAIILGGCAAKPLLPGSQAVVLSKNPPPAHCQFLGEVRGNQGNFWTAEFTSDADLVQGARNELRNAATNIGASYVQVETEVFSQNTADDSLGGTYSAIVIGNAYQCQGKQDVVRQADFTARHEAPNPDVL